jgi:hypothetical protein
MLPSGSGDAQPQDEAEVRGRNEEGDIAFPLMKGRFF